MSAIDYESGQQDWDDYEDEQTLPFPGRRRRQFWGRGSAVLVGLVLVALAFYAGVRVEKSQLSSSATTTAVGTGARGGAAGALASRFGAGAAGATGGRAGSAAGGFATGAFGGGGSSFGTVSSIDGKNVFVTQLSTGNVVKVTLSSATKITKSVGVSKSAIRPGDTVVIQGVKGSNGTISATSLSDSGASARSSAGGSGSGSSGGAGSAVSSLFGSGGGGG